MEIVHCEQSLIYSFKCTCLRTQMLLFTRLLLFFVALHFIYFILKSIKYYLLFFICIHIDSKKKKILILLILLILMFLWQPTCVISKLVKVYTYIRLVLIFSRGSGSWNHDKNLIGQESLVMCLSCNVTEISTTAVSKYDNAFYIV